MSDINEKELHEKLISMYMKEYNFTREQAERILEEDCDIKKEFPQLYELPPYKEKPILPKQEPMKIKARFEIISEMANFLKNSYQDVEIIHPDRIIKFKNGNKKYEFTLTEKRK